MDVGRRAVPALGQLQTVGLPQYQSFPIKKKKILIQYTYPYIYQHAYNQSSTSFSHTLIYDNI